MQYAKGFTSCLLLVAAVVMGEAVSAGVLQGYLVHISYVLTLVCGFALALT